MLIGILLFSISAHADSNKYDKLVGKYSGRVYTSVNDFIEVETSLVVSEQRLGGHFTVGVSDKVYHGEIPYKKYIFEETSRQLTVNWSDKHGKGWIVLTFTPEYHTFVGIWGAEEHSLSDAKQQGLRWTGVDPEKVTRHKDELERLEDELADKAKKRLEDELADKAKRRAALELKLVEKIKKFKVENKKKLVAQPGFRDLKPGLSREEAKALCRVDNFASLSASFEAGEEMPANYKLAGTPCYKIDNLRFFADFVSEVIYVWDGNIILSRPVAFIRTLRLDMGPIVDAGIVGNSLNFSSNPESGNILFKMRSNLDKKYEKTFEFTDRDRQLFNEGEKDEIFDIYSKGKVVLRVVRVKEKYSEGLRLFLEYRNEKTANEYVEENMPKKASSSDF